MLSFWWGHAELWWRAGLQTGRLPPHRRRLLFWLHVAASLLQPGLVDGRGQSAHGGGCTPVRGSARCDPMQHCWSAGCLQHTVCVARWAVSARHKHSVAWLCVCCLGPSLP